MLTGAATSDTRDHSHSRVAIVFVAVFFVLLAGRLLRLTSRYAVNIFFWDQWIFNNAALFQHHSAWEMFRWQFGPRLGLGPLVSKLFDPHFHWNSRAESYLACAIVIVAAVSALWLKHRLFGTFSVWDVAIPILYLSASQYESLFVDTNLSHGSLPLLLITLYCLAWTIRNVGVRYVLVLVLNFVTTYTTFAVFLGFLTPLLLALDYWANLKNTLRGTIYAAVAVLLSLASLASYFYGYRLQPAVNCFSPTPHAPAQYLWYASLMFANLWITGTGFFPRLIGLAAIVWLIWIACAALRKMFTSQSPRCTVYAIAALLPAFSLLFAFAAAYGRVCLGMFTAQSSRYTNYLILGIFGSYLYLLSMPAQRLRRVLLTIMTVALLANVPIRSQDRHAMGWLRNVKLTWRQCYLQGGTIAKCDAAAGYKIEPEPPPVLQQKLDFLKERRLNLFCTMR